MSLPIAVINSLDKFKEIILGTSLFLDEIFIPLLKSQMK